MKKKCPICQTELNTNCYVKDNGTAALSYLELIIKNDNLKKKNYELIRKIAYNKKIRFVD